MTRKLESILLVAALSVCNFPVKAQDPVSSFSRGFESGRAMREAWEARKREKEAQRAEEEAAAEERALRMEEARRRQNELQERQIASKIAQLRKDAYEGDLEAMRVLGYLFLTGEHGVGYKPDDAFFYFNQAARAGDANSAYAAARMILDHRVTFTDRLPQLLHAAAEAGISDAMLALGDMHADQDGSSAEVWYAKAAQAGEPRAQAKLGRLYLEGDAPANAYALLLSAASAGQIDAQIDLSQMYLDGKGISVDPVAAHAWASLAALENPRGVLLVRTAEDRMTSKQVRQAKRLAKDLKMAIDKQARAQAEK